MVERERELWACVLGRAVSDLYGLDLVGGDPRNAEQIRDAALSWFLSDDNEPPSFRWVCDQLEIDHRAARRRILALKSRELLKKRLRPRPRRSAEPFIPPPEMITGCAAPIKFYGQIRRAAAPV